MSDDKPMPITSSGGDAVAPACIGDHYLIDPPLVRSRMLTASQLALDALDREEALEASGDASD